LREVNQLVKSAPNGFQAVLAFMIDETEPLAEIINLSQQTNVPVAPVFYDALQDLLKYFKEKISNGKYHPRVETALGLLKESNKDAYRSLFKKCYAQGLQKLQEYLDNNSAMDLYKRLRVLDPRNIRDVNVSWADISDLFGQQKAPGDDEDLQDKKDRLNSLLEAEWNRYCRIETHSVQNHADIHSFWQARGTLIYDTVCPYLFYPTTSAAVERSFSLAGLIDTKNRTKMGDNLRQAAVMMFCNGDVEGR
jgi:hypothetical protein